MEKIDEEFEEQSDINFDDVLDFNMPSNNEEDLIDLEEDESFYE